MASRSRLLHLPFKDPDGNNDDAHVLLRVSPVSDDPSHPSASSSLDLELLATQGTDAFVATCKSSLLLSLAPSFVYFSLHLKTHLQPALSIRPGLHVFGPLAAATLPGPFRLGHENGPPFPQPYYPGTETWLSSHPLL